MPVTPKPPAYCDARSTSRMVREDVDWKNQPRNPLDWFLIVLSVLLVVLYLGTWVRTGGRTSLVLGLFLGVWLGVYFSRFWQPILYLLVAVVLGAKVGVEIVSGIPDGPLNQFVLATTVVFLVVVVYLLANEEAYR